VERLSTHLLPEPDTGLRKLHSGASRVRDR
jgi:hypothetical protein